MKVTGTQVFVQVGPIPDYAWHYIIESSLLCPNFSTVLITDQQVKNPPVGVLVLELSSIVGRSEIKALKATLESSTINAQWRENYWLRIFLRFLALRNYCQGLDENAGLVIHLECDLATYTTEALALQLLATATSSCLIPFIDHETACPGIILAKSPDAMSKLCAYVVNELASDNEISDMNALAKAGEAGLLGPLPTQPEQSNTTMTIQLFDTFGQPGDSQEADCIFDAAAVGQYLFGIDPRNNSGQLIPGYRETRGGLDPGQWTDWRLALSNDGFTRPTFVHNSRRFVLLNLHVHAKTIVPRPSLTDESWDGYLAIANGTLGARVTFTSNNRLANLLHKVLLRIS